MRCGRRLSTASFAVCIPLFISIYASCVCVCLCVCVCVCVGLCFHRRLGPFHGLLLAFAVGLFWHSMRHV